MKRKIVVFFLLIFFLNLGMSSSSSAYNVYVNEVLGTTQITATLDYTGSETLGYEMAGMAVTANFFGGGSETIPWASNGFFSGIASGTGWSLSQADDTFTSQWTLSTTSTQLAGFKVDAGLGNTVFDRTFGGGTGTILSSLGKDFVVTSSGSGNITAIYLDQVALSGFLPVGDLFRFLDVRFDQNLGFSGSLAFLADTDQESSFRGFRTCYQPATILFLGVGLIGLAGYGRKKLI